VEVDGVRELPNDRLHARDTERGSGGGLNIQDANLLRVEVTYGHALKVPLVGSLLARVLSSARERDAFHQQLLRRGRLPITATATVRMQSPLRFSELLVSRNDLPDADRIAVDVGPAGGGESHDQEAAATDDTASAPGSSGDAGSNLGEGFFGFGAGEVPSASSSDDDSIEHGEDDSSGESAAANNPPLCSVA